MSNSRSFDRAAGIYDQTRPLFEPIAKNGLQAILDITGPNARLLDVGTGTGRISVPLLERGTDLIGCDISSKMLSRLKEKLPSARIAQSDAARLPFPTAHFDVVLTVHVLHLISPWREALREFRRVLKPEGVYLNVKTWESAGASIREQLRVHWRRWLDAQGVSAGRVGIQNEAEFQQELQGLGGHLTEVEVIRYALPFTLREELERFESRVNSDTWDIPDDIFAQSMQELRAWVESEFGDLDPDGQLTDEVRFVIDVVRFEGP
jgi:ubiquinone/menaquinone biosynthesis C-methylase UbiE